jgi:hypothetical protein
MWRELKAIWNVFMFCSRLSISGLLTYKVLNAKLTETVARPI